VGVKFDKRQMTNLTVAIKQTGEKAARRAISVMEEEGREIADLARSYAPFDEGMLEDAIKSERVPGGRDEKGRFVRDAIQVYVDADMPGSGGARTVGEYAYLMHEELGPYGSGRYNPGPGTRAKGPQAGGKFLDRAVRDRAKAFIQKMKTAISKSFR
jgi:hypothetical protein